MSALAARAGQILVVVLGATAGYLYMHVQHARLDAANTALETASKSLEAATGLIDNLRELVHRREVAAAKLEGERNAIRDAASSRELLMRKLQDENAEIRAWAITAVPADVARLRDHGPLTGAAAYRQFLSEGATLQPASRAGEE